MRNPKEPPFGEYFYNRGRGGGHRRGRGRGIGRPPVSYPVRVYRSINQEQGNVELTSFELQILRLADIEGLTQQEIAEKLDISQTSVWRYLKAIRIRITEAISQHNQIFINIID